MAKIEIKPKLNRIKHKIVQLLEYSTFHGVPNIVRAKRLFPLIMWSILTILSIFVGSYYAINNIIDYSKYNTINKIEIINEHQLEFPSITICAFPMINSTLNETILRLRFDNIYETNIERYFEEFNDTVWGKCFRFNSGRNILNQTYYNLNSSSPGRPNGFRIDINLDILPDNYDFSKVILLIHNSSLPPLNPNKEAFWTKTGKYNIIL